MRHRFIDDQSGATVIEYGLMAVLIASTFLYMVKAGMSLVGIDLVGMDLSAIFQFIAAAF